MQIRPQHPPVHLLDRLKQVMVVVPVDAEKDETQHITQKYGKHGAQRGGVGAERHLQFQHHDGDEDRDHTITERFQSPLAQGRLTKIVEPLLLPSGSWLAADL